MFIIKKQQIIMILFSILLIFSFFLATEKSDIRSFDIKQVSALPVDNKVIVIDAGHRW